MLGTLGIKYILESDLSNDAKTFVLFTWVIGNVVALGILAILIYDVIDIILNKQCEVTWTILDLIK